MKTLFLLYSEKSAIYRTYGDTFSPAIRKKRYPSDLWRHFFSCILKKALSIGLMETLFLLYSEKSAIHPPYGDTFSPVFRKKRYPSVLWRHFFSCIPKKALSIRLMETLFLLYSEKSAIHRIYGDTSSRTF